MGKLVYVVTQGEYSDYHIVAVCTTKEIAEKTADDVGGCEVEVFSLNTSVPKVYHYFCWVSGETGEVKRVIKYFSLVQHLGLDMNGDFFGRGATKEEAIKIVRDYRAKCMAKEAGL